MSNDFAPSNAGRAVADLTRIVADGVKDAADRVSAALDAERQPGRSLDVLAKITRQAPIGALLAAFVVGAIVARRRRW
jgi:MYXO-CTERM domain-containing protein